MTRASPPNVGGGRAQGAGRPTPLIGRGPACYHRTEDRADEVVDLRSRSWRPGKGSVAQMRCSGPGSAANPAGLAPVIPGTEPDSAEPADLRNTRTMLARYAASAESAFRALPSGTSRRGHLPCRWPASRRVTATAPAKSHAHDPVAGARKGTPMTVLAIGDARCLLAAHGQRNTPCYASFAMSAGRHSRRASVAGMPIQWASPPSSPWHRDPHLGGPSRRMAVPRLTSRTVTAGLGCGARDPPIWSAIWSPG